MSYTLNGTDIRPPSNMNEKNVTQYAQQKTLSGAVGRDYFGNNKRTWVLSYNNVNATDYSTINTIYQAYLSTGSAKSWAVSEANYTVTATTVHIDLLDRGFSTNGTDYLSSFDLILTEA